MYAIDCIVFFRCFEVVVLHSVELYGLSLLCRLYCVGCAVFSRLYCAAVNVLCCIDCIVLVVLCTALVVLR